MVGIPWVEIKRILSSVGLLPMLGWPPGEDPMRCMFRLHSDKVEAIRAGVIIADRGLRAESWEDLR